MWQLDEHRAFRNMEVVLIHSEYEDLIFHDFPILFTGRNQDDERVVGSFVEHLPSADVYLHSIVSDRVYSNFENQIITYRELLQQARFIFQLQLDEAGELKAVWVNYADIPTEYLPTETAKCPALSFPKSEVEIEARFAGGRSERHVVTPETASAFQTDWASILRGMFSLEGLKNLRSNVLLQARQSQQLLAYGSVKINYKLTFEEKENTLFFEPERFAPFVESYVRYCLNHLTEDAPSLAKRETLPELVAFQGLLDAYIGVFHYRTPDRADEGEKLAKSLIRAAKKLGDISELVGTDVRSIEFTSLHEQANQALGVFDSGFASEIVDSLEKVEIAEGKAPVTDREAQNYRIHIYELNVNSRFGRALFESEDGNEIIKPTVKILGDDSLDHSKYSSSLHESKWIDVRARATRSGDKIRRLEIEFEDEE